YCIRLSRPIRPFTCPQRKIGLGIMAAAVLQFSPTASQIPGGCAAAADCGPQVRTTRLLSRDPETSDMDFRLSEEQQAFAQAAREFAQGELAPNAAHWDAHDI